MEIEKGPEVEQLEAGGQIDDDWVGPDVGGTNPDSKSTKDDRTGKNINTSQSEDDGTGESTTKGTNKTKPKATAKAKAKTPAKPVPRTKTKAPDHAPCLYAVCERRSEKGSDHCLFHMPAAEKTEKDLWEQCDHGFQKLLVIGEGEFQGFVLQGMDISGRFIDHDLDLSHTHFHEKVVLSGPTKKQRSEFKGEVNLEGAVFEQDMQLTWAKFRSEVDLKRTKFKAGLDLRASHFRSLSHFDRMECEGIADLSQAIFEEYASFRETRFGTNGRFKGTYFEKGGNFDRAQFCFGDFEEAGLQYVSFRQVCLDHVRFAGAMMENAYLADAWWTPSPDRSNLRKLADEISVADPRFVVREEEETMTMGDEDTETRVKAYRKAESTYRRLKHTHTNEGDYSKAGEFYIHEMRMKQARYWTEPGWRNRSKLFWNIFYNVTCGYGERPKRVILNALLVILVFGLLYNSMDGIEKDDIEDYDPSLKECVYFSVVTFTTLGYGDYAPKPETQLLATVEAFTGAFTIALFVLVFARKVMR